MIKMDEVAYLGIKNSKVIRESEGTESCIKRTQKGTSYASLTNYTISMTWLERMLLNEILRNKNANVKCRF